MVHFCIEPFILYHIYRYYVPMYHVHIYCNGFTKDLWFSNCPKVHMLYIIYTSIVCVSVWAQMYNIIFIILCRTKHTKIMFKWKFSSHSTRRALLTNVHTIAAATRKNLQLVLCLSQKTFAHTKPNPKWNKNDSKKKPGFLCRNVPSPLSLSLAIYCAVFVKGTD